MTEAIKMRKFGQFFKKISNPGDTFFLNGQPKIPDCFKIGSGIDIEILANDVLLFTPPLMFFELLNTLKVGGVNGQKINAFGYVTNVTSYLLCLYHRSFCSINIH